MPLPFQQVAQEKQASESKWKEERKKRLKTEQRLKLAEDSLKRLDKVAKLKNHMHITCTSHAHHMRITCTSRAHHMHIACTSHAHHMHIIYIPYFHTYFQALKDSGVHIDMAVETDVKNLRSNNYFIVEGGWCALKGR